MITPRERILDDVRLVALAHGVSMHDVLSRSRRRADVRARQAAMWFVWWRHGWSTSQVGRLFGRDHTTVISNIAAHMMRARLDHHWIALYRKHAERRERSRVQRRKVELAQRVSA